MLAQLHLAVHDEECWARKIMNAFVNAAKVEVARIGLQRCNQGLRSGARRLRRSHGFRARPESCPHSRDCRQSASAVRRVQEPQRTEQQVHRTSSDRGGNIPPWCQETMPDPECSAPLALAPTRATKDCSPSLASPGRARVGSQPRNNTSPDGVTITAMVGALRQPDLAGGDGDCTASSRSIRRRSATGSTDCACGRTPR